ncbi:hypothetical protein AQ490_20080 [Wenjunlia vitaminophila]|uniref:DUF1963 domain-containing protein n=1 Tax=Wenjunlia vitaminophila TaxID=76728 RepID=A0A0T6LUW0_WENVI|nr:hypothetical protein [Wenjunlia vitaminophila]KRV49618.1 hypothetical protein AQ490_20080 [Wenjunlia vitaminophila]
MTEYFPEVADLARPTTLLYPRAGRPSVHASSMGGPLLWPADEPWPHCRAPDHYRPLRQPVETVGPEAVALVPVLQLYAREVPDLLVPTGSDLLQMLWCPLMHPPSHAPSPVLRWWRTSDIVMGPLLTQPPPPWEYDEQCVPRPCVVHPTRATEYPGWDLPGELGQVVRRHSAEIEETLGLSYWDAAVATQTKVGGYPGWTQPPDWPVCGCGRRMEHLLTVHSREPAMGDPWLPEEDRVGSGPMWRRPVAPDVEPRIGPGLSLGDMGGVYVFVCTVCPGSPYEHRYDCALEDLQHVAAPPGRRAEDRPFVPVTGPAPGSGQRSPHW